MRIQRAELTVYNARAVDLLKRWQEHRVPCGDVDAIAGPQPDSMAALLGYEAEAIPLGLEDRPLVVEGFVDFLRSYRGDFLHQNYFRRIVSSTGLESTS
jgi:hypothetical protein